MGVVYCVCLEETHCRVCLGEAPGGTYVETTGGTCFRVCPKAGCFHVCPWGRHFFVSLLMVPFRALYPETSRCPGCHGDKRFHWGVVSGGARFHSGLRIIQRSADGLCPSGFCSLSVAAMAQGKRVVRYRTEQWRVEKKGSS